MMAKEDQGTTAAGFNNVGESQTKIPEGVLNPNIASPTGANPQFDLINTETAAVAGIPNVYRASVDAVGRTGNPDRFGDSVTAGGRAGNPNTYGDCIATRKPVDAKIPEGVMKPNMVTTGADSALTSAETVTKNPTFFRDPTNIAAGEPVDASGKKLAEVHAKIPEGIMQPKATPGVNPEFDLTSTKDAAGTPKFAGNSANISAGEPVDGRRAEVGRRAYEDPGGNHTAKGNSGCKSTVRSDIHNGWCRKS